MAQKSLLNLEGESGLPGTGNLKRKWRPCRAANLDSHDILM
jgi:hypothetical protein